MTRRTVTYEALIEPGDESGFVVSFPDVPEAITEGDTREEAIDMGASALERALRLYALQGRPLPKGKARRGLTPITVQVDLPERTMQAR